MCSQTGRGRLAKRIFGKGGGSEDGANHVLPGFCFQVRMWFGHKATIGLAELSCGFGLQTKFG